MLIKSVTWSVVMVTLAIASLVSFACEGEPATQNYTLTIDVIPSGAGSVSPSGGEFESGAPVVLTAFPTSGYEFDCWEGSVSATMPTITIIMDSNKSLTAHFKATVLTAPVALFSDDFSGEPSVWDTYSMEGTSVFHQDGWLHLINTTESPYYTDTYIHKNFSDFVLEVDTKFVGGSKNNWHAILIRVQEDCIDTYYFCISADGCFQIGKVDNENDIILVDSTMSIHINQEPDVVNHIRIECIDSNLSLSVNGHMLREVTDTTFTAGDIGLAAISLGDDFTEIAFDNIVVTEP